MQPWHGRLRRIGFIFVSLFIFNFIRRGPRLTCIRGNLALLTGHQLLASLQTWPFMDLYFIDTSRAWYTTPRSPLESKVLSIAFFESSSWFDTNTPYLTEVRLCPQHTSCTSQRQPDCQGQYSLNVPDLAILRAHVCRSVVTEFVLYMLQCCHSL